MKVGFFIYSMYVTFIILLIVGVTPGTVSAIDESPEYTRSSDNGDLSTGSYDDAPGPFVPSDGEDIDNTNLDNAHNRHEWDYVDWDSIEEDPDEIPTQEPQQTSTETEQPIPIEIEKPTPMETETEMPTVTEQPTEEPTEQPTETETEQPTPTEEPTLTETEQPTPTETEQPIPMETETEAPTVTEQPNEEPTEQPTETETEQPTPTETEQSPQTPVQTPTQIPQETPTQEQQITPTPPPPDSGSNSNSDSNSGSESGSHAKSSMGSGVSQEAPENIAAKELDTENIISGYHIKYDFKENATPITYIEYDAKRTFRKTTSIAELLINKSSLVPELPYGKIYRHVNIWVGQQGAGFPTSIENGLVGFKVEKTWIRDDSINETYITLQRFDKDWQPLNTEKIGEDETYLYFKAKTPGYSSFAIIEFTPEDAKRAEIERTGQMDTALQSLTNNTAKVLYANVQKQILAQKATKTAKIIMALSLPLFMLVAGYCIFKKKI